MRAPGINQARAGRPERSGATLTLGPRQARRVDIQQDWIVNPGSTANLTGYGHGQREIDSRAVTRMLTGRAPAALNSDNSKGVTR